MLHITSTRAVIAAVAACAVGASLAGASTSAQAASGTQSATASTSVVTHSTSLTPEVARLAKGTGVAAESAAVTQYWTADRMKAARSLDATITGKAPAKSATTPQGPATAIKGAAPLKAPKVAETPAVSSSYDFPNLPYYHPTARTVGKVFFSRSSGGLTYNYVCSAAVVNTEGKSTVWTAGHCLYDYHPNGTRVWSSNFAFVPSYSNGSRPYGTWTARSLTTSSGWFYNRDFTQDVGAATMNRNFGYRIADYLGAQGITWNATASYYATAFGYPQGSPFNGAYLVRAQGWTTASGGSIYMYSGMTGGSSGGPWLRNYDGSYGLINGHNDYVYTSSPNWMYSPYYGNQVAAVYNAVRNQSS